MQKRMTYDSKIVLNETIMLQTNKRHIQNIDQSSCIITSSYFGVIFCAEQKKCLHKIIEVLQLNGLLSVTQSRIKNDIFVCKIVTEAQPTTNKLVNIGTAI